MRHAGGIVERSLSYQAASMTGKNLFVMLVAADKKTSLQKTGLPSVIARNGC
jgi:hypothetical protein